MFTEKEIKQLSYDYIGNLYGGFKSKESWENMEMKRKYFEDGLITSINLLKHNFKVKPKIKPFDIFLQIDTLSNELYSYNIERLFFLYFFNLNRELRDLQDLFYDIITV